MGACFTQTEPFRPDQFRLKPTPRDGLEEALPIFGEELASLSVDRQRNSGQEARNDQIAIEVSRLLGVSTYHVEQFGDWERIEYVPNQEVNNKDNEGSINLLQLEELKDFLALKPV